MNTQLQQYPDEKVMMAPQWVYDLAEIDLLDALMGTVGTVGAYAAGGIPGVIAWGGFTVTVTVLRKTPVIPWAVRTYLAWRANPKVINGKFRDAVIPAWKDDATEVVVHPRHREQVAVSRQREANSREQGAVSGEQTTVREARPARKVLPGFVGFQIVVYGPTGSGKSSVIKLLIMLRPKHRIIVIDPKYKPGNWPSRSYVVGKGLNFKEIDAALDALLGELKRRIEALGEGQTDFRPLLVAVDELSILTQYVPDAGERLIQIAQLGREVQMFTILTPHSTEVEQMGFQGKGNARENFVYIGLPPINPLDEGAKHKPRVATVHLGSPRRKGNEPLGKFVVPIPRRYTGTPKFGLPAFIQQGVPGVSPAGVPERSGDSVPGSRDTLGTGTETVFAARYSDPDSEDARKLAMYLAGHGFGTRKIAKFLPFGNTAAGQLAREVLHGMEQRPPRPAPGSEAEQEMIRYLHWDCGAPLERIAKLLDGNTWENLARISRVVG